MGDHAQNTWNEIVQFFAKGLVWLSYISIGVIAKLAFDSRKETLTKKQVIVKSVLSIFSGYSAAVVCENLNYETWGKLIIPVSTLLGEGLVAYVMTNWKRLAIKFLPGGANLKEDDKTK